MPRRGVRVPAGMDLTVEDLARYVVSRYPDAVISHLSAARLWEFPLPVDGEPGNTSGLRIPVRHDSRVATPRTDLPPDLHISLPPGIGPLRWEGVQAHNVTFSEHDVVVRDAFRVTGRVRTWFDLVSELDDTWAVVIADHLLREPRPRFEGRSSPFVSVANLERIVEEQRGRRGRAKALRALERARVGADSPQETRLRLALVDAGIPEPLLNQRIRDERGLLYHQPDMQWPRWKVTGGRYRSVEHYLEPTRARR